MNPNGAHDPASGDTALREGFHNILAELVQRFSHVHRAVRMQALVTAALAMVDAQSIEDRNGVVVTEAEFILLCRRVFRKLRGMPAI